MRSNDKNRNKDNETKFHSPDLNFHSRIGELLIYLACEYWMDTATIVRSHSEFSKYSSARNQNRTCKFIFFLFTILFFYNYLFFLFISFFWWNFLLFLNGFFLAIFFPDITIIFFDEKNSYRYIFYFHIFIFTFLLSHACKISENFFEFRLTVSSFLLSPLCDF